MVVAELDALAEDEYLMAAWCVGPALGANQILYIKWWRHFVAEAVNLPHLAGAIEGWSESEDRNTS